MNTSPVVSQVVGEDLSASNKSHISLKLTATGLMVAGAADLVIGTLLRGNVAPQAGQVIPTNFQPAADVFLRSANGLNFVKLGVVAAPIAMGDELVQDALGTWIEGVGAAGANKVIAWDSAPTGADGAIIRALML
jgi:hypothetical protein